MKPALAAFIPVAELFGRLLLQEIDAQLLRELRHDEVSKALADVGLFLPDLPTAELLDELAAEYCSCFLGPADPVPLIQSVWEGGSYESGPAAAIRQIATQTGIEFDREAARSAPADHLGCILLLWAELVESCSEHAGYLVQHHFAWARRPLQLVARRGGFYGQLCAAVDDLLEHIKALSV
ncbi:MAG: hypothetical protein KatS3mg105_0821 [Gemmatales bacterium]|nr:MAG: hypothetical protein KatS3mg105_0821 [Gemmatales bacterium]